MSEFDDLWAEIADPLLVEQYAEEVLCTPAGLTQRAVTAIVWPTEIVKEEGQRGVRHKYTKRIGVPRTSQAANGGTFYASPGLHDVWTIDGIGYAVSSIESQTETETVLCLERSATHEETRDGLRRRN